MQAEAASRQHNPQTKASSQYNPYELKSQVTASHDLSMSGVTRNYLSHMKADGGDMVSSLKRRDQLEAKLTPNTTLSDEMVLRLKPSVTTYDEAYNIKLENANSGNTNSNNYQVNAQLDTSSRAAADADALNSSMANGYVS